MVKESFQQIKKNTPAMGIQTSTDILRGALLHNIIWPHYNLCMFVAWGTAKSIQYLVSLYRVILIKYICIFILNLLDSQRILKKHCHRYHKKKIPQIIIELWLQAIIMLSLINSHCKMLASYSDLLVHNFSHRFFFYFFFFF